MAKAVQYNYNQKSDKYKATTAEWKCFKAAHKKLYPHMYRSRGEKDRKPKIRFTGTTSVQTKTSDDIEAERQDGIEHELRLLGYLNINRNFRNLSEFFLLCENSDSLTTLEKEVYEQTKWMNNTFHLMRGDLHNPRFGND